MEPQDLAIMAQEETAALPAQQPTPTFQDLMDRFLAEVDISDNSKQTYRRSLRQFFNWYEAQGLTTVSRAELLAYKAHLMATRRAATVNSYLAAVKSFFAWLEAEKLYPNISSGVKIARAAKGFKKEALTPAQVKRTLDLLQGPDERDLRNYAIFNLLVRTGLRTIEIHRANIEDISNKGGQTVLYIQGKGRHDKDAFVVLTEATLRPLYAYLATRKQRDLRSPLFASLANRSHGKRLSIRSHREIVKTALRDAGYDDERLTTHSLRHTAITLALLGGASIQQAQAMARHSNINTTLVYAHNLDRIASAPEHLLDALLDG